MSSRNLTLAALTQEDIEICRAIFADLDKDGSGTIDAVEFGEALVELGIDSQSEDMEGMLRSVEKQGITFDGFLEFFAGVKYRNVAEDDDEDEELNAAAANRSTRHIESSRIDPHAAAAELSRTKERLDMLLNMKDMLQELVTRLHMLRGGKGGVTDAEREDLLAASADQVALVISSLQTNDFNYTPPPPQQSVKGKVQLDAEGQASHVLHFIGGCIEGLSAKIQELSEAAIEYVEIGVNGFEDDDARALSPEELTKVASMSFLKRTRSFSGSTSGIDKERLAVQLEELANFSLEMHSNEKPVEGAEAFRQKAKEFPFFLFPITTICEQLDFVDDLYYRYANQIGMNEFLLKPKCPDGKMCKLQNVPEHRLELTHPCYANPPCPHMNRQMHMRCYYHGDDETNRSLELQLKEMAKNLGTLDVSGCEMGDYGAQCMAFVLLRDLSNPSKEQRKYRQLKLSGNHISPVGAIPILDFATDLVSLDLSNNFLGYKGSQLVGGGVGSALHHLLQRSYRLTHLDLSRNRLGDNEGKWIAEGLRTNVILKHIDLRKNEFGPQFGIEMAAALNDNRDLSELLIGWNRLEGSGSLALLNELQSNSTIEVIDLSWTGINEEGAKCVARMISGSMILKALNLSHNSIGRQGTLMISKALIGNKTLQTLDLSFNPIGDRPVTELVRDLRENNTLEFLDIRCVKAGDETTKEINQTLRAREPKMKEQRILFSVGVTPSSAGV